MVVAGTATNLMPLQPLWANPQGGVVAAGQAKISSSGNVLTVTEQSNRAIVNWAGFDIAAGETTRFVQPSSDAIVVNRINSAAASSIDGNLLANGNIVLINPNGVLFGKGAHVDVNGLVATTADIDADRFINGGPLVFNQPGNPRASIINNGTITAAQAGLVGLVAPNVVNNGSIIAKRGRVQLASADTATIDFYGDGLMEVAVSDQVRSQLVANNGLIEADGGKVALTAAAGGQIVNSLITDDGVLKAQSIGRKNGDIIIDSGANGTVDIAGTLNVSGKHKGQTGGVISIVGNHIHVGAKARLLAKGSGGGGSINVGSWNSASVDAAQGSVMDASAVKNGKGGAVSVLSDATSVHGTILATGGAQGGDGGTVETSGHTLDFEGAAVSTLAPLGKTGNWLLDPYDLTVDATAAATIESGLVNSNVTLQTFLNSASGPGNQNASGSGDIIIASPISWNANTLTLDAYHNVLINANLNATSSSAGLAIVTNDGGTGGNFLTGPGASVTFASTGSPFNINGTSYTLLASATDITGISSLTGNYALANDVDLLGIANFTPIGFGNQYTGTFEGLGHAISNLTVDADAAPFGATNGLLGLFSHIGSGGTVRNLNVSGSVTGDTGAGFGLLAGENNGTIVNAHANGTVSDSGAGAVTGGLVGQNNGVITGSDAAGQVLAAASAQFIGGLVGINDNGGSITGSNATNHVTAGNGAQFIGGFDGYQGSTASIAGSSASGQISIGNSISVTGGFVGWNNGGVITGSSSSDGITAGDTAHQVGGFVGNNGGGITNSHATGPISTGIDAQLVGGFVGTHGGTPGIDNSYATGVITVGDGSVDIGGFVGGSGGAITNSYSTVNIILGISDNTVGGFVGFNVPGALTLSGDYASGQISAGNSSTIIGGFVGANESTIISSHASGALVLADSTSQDGGFVGHNGGGTITASYATGDVSTGSSSTVGGFAGTDFHSISGSYATGSVTLGASSDTYGGFTGQVSGATETGNHATGNVSGGSSFVARAGGYAGDNTGTIQNSYATGIVQVNPISSAPTEIGGLVGSNETGASITASYATGNINGGTGSVGGLAGLNNGSIATSYAAGTVTVTSGGSSAGGLVGTNAGTITNSYSLSPIANTASFSQVGGLVGANSGAISFSYATGPIDSARDGLVGANSGGTYTGDYWDVTTTGQANGCNTSATCGGGATGLTTAQWLTQGPQATGATGWDLSNTWLAGYPYPVLRALPYIVITGSGSKTYGTAFANADVSIASILDQNGANASSSVDISSLSWISNAATASNVADGPFVLGGGGAVSTAATPMQITYEGSLSVTAKMLTVSGLSAPSSKPYDGTTAAVVSGTPTLSSSEAFGAGSGTDGKPYAGDTINLLGTATGTYNSKDVGTADLITYGGLTSSNGDYTLNLGAQAATITPKQPTVTAQNKTIPFIPSTVTQVSENPMLNLAVTPGPLFSPTSENMSEASLSLCTQDGGDGLSSGNMCGSGRIALPGL